ncbi:hypothetical protein DFR70_11026 [Nocardia tenerifensis]|uniref:4-hydroxybenzoate polyprenyltransferase n=1 Tax=Nocardia tenerifensis TaxID=228006 RepID=A0A318JZL9_9NOCA|nr:membrane protein [Nocardia tenerifensis]PXX60186.1 hypothetical protein DFR70_11026 [Nocardia tenerifensis]
MGSVGVTRPLASAARIARFTAVMYKPHYLLYGVLWVLGLEGTASLVTQPDSEWRPTGATVVRIVVVAFVLLYLRMVDEQKDLEYDRVHNPDRPLVTGAVSAVELRVAMGLIAVGAVAGSLALSVGSAVMITVAMAYGLVLWGLERLFDTVRTGILVNLVVTYPVQLLVTGYVVVSAIDTGEVRAHWRAAAVAAVFAGAFLQFEFARKTSRERRPDELLYSNALGPNGSAAASLLCAAAAVVVDLVLVRPWDHSVSLIAWLVVALLLIPAIGAWKFVRGDRTEYPIGPAVVFILALYLTLIGQALVLP